MARSRKGAGTALAVTADIGVPAVFDPEQTKVRVGKADAIITLARKVKDWPLLEKAVDAKIEEQTRFVAWWDDTVQANKRPKKQGAKRRRKKASLTVSDTETVNALSAEEAQKKTEVTKVQVTRWRGRLKDRAKYRTMLIKAPWKVAMESAAQRNQQSLSNEHYTPTEYVEAARGVLDDIDLDPATCETANNTVQANTYFDAAANGLEKEWHGKVWLNPPYGKDVGKFVAKFIEEFKAGRVEGGVILVNAHCTDTAWFQPLWDGLLCFTDHRINFYGDDKRSGSTHGSVFVYFGPNEAAFVREYRKHGPIVRKVVP